MELKSKHDEIEELCNKLFIYTDYRKWNQLQEEVFTGEILFDMSSLGAGAPKKMTSKALCDMWDVGFKGIDHVHHQSANYIINFVSDIEADIFCYAIAIHYKASAVNEKTREFVGSYDLHAIFTDLGWRLDQFKYNVKFVNGNKDLI